MVAETPHGGFKHSGYGKDLSLNGFEGYTGMKRVMSNIEGSARFSLFSLDLADQASYTRAMAVCGGCGKFGPEEARFCSACGSPLVATPLFERSARKTVTVVFADIAGSTELGDRLDPETVRQVMSRYFRTTRRVLERHGGTVEKFIGDAVMAVFGIPVVHEDDALRAVPRQGEARFCARGAGPHPHIGHAVHDHGFPVRRPRGGTPFPSGGLRALCSRASVPLGDGPRRAGNRQVAVGPRGA
jgi:hypothetical protein